MLTPALTMNTKSGSSIWLVKKEGVKQPEKM